jgi:hypothetical protein
MKKLSLIAAMLLLASNTSFAEESEVAITTPTTTRHIEAHSVELDEAKVGAEQEWTLKLSAEGRVRPETNVNQFLTKFDFGYTLSEDFSLFASVWLRNRQQDGYTTNTNFLTAGDFFVGVYYDLYKYINPYAFYEMYLDGEKGDWNTYDSVWSGFGAVGIGGTLYSEGKHSVSYYVEYYFALGTQEGGYAVDFENNFDQYGSESALKYTYSVYDKTSLYVQPTWYTYGPAGLSDGVFEARFGISVAF